jgi:hypothetical protein
VWRRGAERRPFDVHARAAARLASVTAVKLAAQAVDLVHDAAGMNAVKTSGDIQRCWRDVHTITQHVILATARYEVVGRVLFGRGAPSSDDGAPETRDARFGLASSAPSAVAHSPDVFRSTVRAALRTFCEARRRNGPAFPGWRAARVTAVPAAPKSRPTDGGIRSFAHEGGARTPRRLASASASVSGSLTHPSVGLQASIVHASPSSQVARDRVDVLAPSRHRIATVARAGVVVGTLRIGRAEGVARGDRDVGAVMVEARRRVVGHELEHLERAVRTRHVRRQRQLDEARPGERSGVRRGRRRRVRETPVASRSARCHTRSRPGVTGGSSGSSLRSATASATR